MMTASSAPFPDNGVPSAAHRACPDASIRWANMMPGNTRPSLHTKMAPDESSGAADGSDFQLGARQTGSGFAGSWDQAARTPPADTAIAPQAKRIALVMIRDILWSPAPIGGVS